MAKNYYTPYKKDKTKYELYSKKLFKVLLIITLFWSIIFFIWLIYNFKDLDSLDIGNYFKCFVHTTIRKINFMKIVDGDCIYSQSNGIINIIRKKIFS